MINIKSNSIPNFLIASSHVAGIVGFIAFSSWFWQLTWFNLILCTSIILLFSKQAIDQILLPFFIAACIGFMVEVIGVKTGFPFGQYYYGKAFGIKFLSVPLLIGVNWAMLNYCSIQVIKKLGVKSNWLYIFSSAALMTGMDYLIEQICMHYQFWYFSTTTSGKAGIANYIAWFCVSMVISYFTLKKFSNHSNTMAIRLFLYQLVFFISLNLYHLLK
jgi:bisanhydrobacterioruberin hydratase